MIDLNAVARTLALLVACAGWPLYAVALDDERDAREEAAMWSRNYEQCVGRVSGDVDRLEDRVRRYERMHEALWARTEAP